MFLGMCGNICDEFKGIPHGCGSLRCEDVPMALRLGTWGDRIVFRWDKRLVGHGVALYGRLWLMRRQWVVRNGKSGFVVRRGRDLLRSGCC